MEIHGLGLPMITTNIGGRRTMMIPLSSNRLTSDPHLHNQQLLPVSDHSLSGSPSLESSGNSQASGGHWHSSTPVPSKALIIKISSLYQSFKPAHNLLYRIYLYM